MEKLPEPGKACRRLLLVINFSLLPVSLAFIAVACIIKFGNGVVSDFIQSSLVHLMSEVKGAGLQDTIHLSAFDFTTILKDVSVAFIIVGVSSLVLNGCGFIAAKKQVFALFIPYTVVLGLVILSQIAVVVVVLVKRDVVDKAITPGLVTDLQQGYRGYNETNRVSQTWNLIMLTLSCCGVHNYMDFDTSVVWRRKVYQDGQWFIMKSPLVCCNMAEKKPDDFSCAVNPSVYTSHFQKGCYDTLWDHLERHKSVAIATVALMLFVQITLFLSSVVLSKTLIQRRKMDMGTKQKSERERADNATMETIDSDSWQMRQGGPVMPQSSMHGLFSASSMALPGQQSAATLQQLLKAYSSAIVNSMPNGNLGDSYMSALMMNAARQQQQMYNSFEPDSYTNYGFQRPLISSVYDIQIPLATTPYNGIQQPSTTTPVLVQIASKASPVLSRLQSRTSSLGMPSDDYSCEDESLPVILNTRSRSKLSRQNTEPGLNLDMSRHSGINDCSKTRLFRQNTEPNLNLNRNCSIGSIGSLVSGSYGGTTFVSQSPVHALGTGHPNINIGKRGHNTKCSMQSFQFGRHVGRKQPHPKPGMFDPRDSDDIDYRDVLDCRRRSGTL